MSAENDQNELIAEARVARQEELIKLLKAQGRDTSEASSMLAGMKYSLKVIRQQRTPAPLRIVATPPGTDFAAHLITSAHSLVREAEDGYDSVLELRNVQHNECIIMPFVVTASDHAKPVTYQRSTAAAAVKKATKLAEEGLCDIEITDLTRGRTYRPDEFHLLPQ
jgi:hypothetical protein